ncbi:MAG: SRPBCC family protein [Agriterribacter sp.]|nr:MAG: hypothetical protein BGP13_11185 [Sphingobacteriales bacterium 40-81]
MKKVLKVIGVILLLVIAFILIAGLFISKSYHYEKTITINAPKDKVWSLVNNFHGQDKWSPWKDGDPNIQISYEGQDGTEGAMYKWKGNKEVGSGEQTLTKLEPMSRVNSHVHFIEPFDGEAETFITLDDAGNNSTKVTWGFDTKYTYPMNTMLLFMNMDKMMGDQYTKGLNRLKNLAEAD